MKNSKERLIHICDGAKKAAERFADNWMARMWAERIIQVENGRVTEKKFADWLRHAADYWRPKDRPYAEYLETLAGSLK